LRQFLKLRHKLVQTLGRQAFTQSGQIDRHHQHYQELSGIGLGGGHRDLRPGPGINDLIGFTGNGRANDIRDRQGSGAQPLGFLQGRQGIAGLAGLADDNHQRARIHQRIPIAELGRDVHLDRDPRQLLQIVLADQTGMIGRPAGGNRDFFDGGDLFPGPLQFVKGNGVVIFVHPGRHRIAESFGLFDDLLDHEMIVAALFRRFRIPVHFKDFFGYRRSLPVGDPDRILGHDGHFAVAENEGPPRAMDNRRNVGSDKIFTFAQTDDQGIVLFGADDLVGFMFGNKDQRIRSADLGQYLFHGFDKIALIVFFHQMGHYFGIRLRQEFVPFFDQALLDVQIIFDDPVVNHHKIAMTIGVRMSVGVGRTAMGCPTGMADAQMSLWNMPFNFLFQAVETSHALFQGNVGAIIHGDAGGIIPAIFQFSQAFQQKWRSLFRTYIAHKATHLCNSSNIR